MHMRKYVSCTSVSVYCARAYVINILYEMYGIYDLYVYVHFVLVCTYA